MTIKHKNSGFTLMEVMIVLAIIGITASIAVPAYQDHVRRTILADVIMVANMARQNMMQYYVKNGRFVPNYSSIDARNKAIGMKESTAYADKYIASVWVGQDGGYGSSNTKVGHVAFKLKEPYFKGRDNFILFSLMAKENAFQWVCADMGSQWKTTIPQKYLPANCRGASR